VDRSNLADSNVKEKVALITIGDVFDEVYRLADENLEIETELADILEKILGKRVVSVAEAQNLLNLKRQNYDDTWLETKISQIGDETFESKSLNRQELQELLDKQERALAEGKDREAIAEELVEKYGAKKSRVNEWLARLEKYQKDLESQGLSKGTARDVAEMAVVKEEEVMERLVKVGVDPVKAAEESRRMVEAVVVLERIEKKSEAVKEILSEVKVEKLVAKKVDAEAKVFISDLKDNIAASGKKFDGFDQANETRVYEQAKVAIKEIWQGKITDMDGAWIPVDGKQMPFVELVSDEIGGDDTSVLIASNALSQGIRGEIKKGKQLQVNYQFFSTKKDIKNEAIKVNPGIEGSDVLDRYAEFAASMTMPVIETGIGEELVEKGSARDVVAKTNMIVGMMIHRAEALETVVKIETYSNEIGGEVMASSPSGRALMEFGNAYKKPEFGQWMQSIQSLFKPSQLLGNRFAVEGLTNVAVRFAGSEVFGGVVTADLVGVTLGQIAQGKGLLEIGLGIKNAGGVANWVAAGKVAASGTTAVAAEGTKLALKETGNQLAAKVAAFLGLQAIPGLGQAITIGLAVLSGVKLAVKGIEGFLGKFGIDLKKLSIGAKVKKFFREDLNLGKFGDLIAIPATIGASLLTGIFAVIASAFAALSVMVAPVIISVVIGLWAYQTFVTSPQASVFMPTKDMIGAGDDEYYGGGEYNPDGPPLIASLQGYACEKVISDEIKQNVGPWADVNMPAGCKIGDSGCGPTSVSMILRAVNSSLTPDVLIERTEYAGAGCSGTSISQNTAALTRELGGGVRNIGPATCTVNFIGESICKGDWIVMILANFYQTDINKVGGHYVVAYAVDEGQIRTKDSFYSDNTPFLQPGEDIHTGAIHSIKGCILVEASKIRGE